EAQAMPANLQNCRTLPNPRRLIPPIPVRLVKATSPFASRFLRRKALLLATMPPELARYQVKIRSIEPHLPTSTNPRHVPAQKAPSDLSAPGRKGGHFGSAAG